MKMLIAAILLSLSSVSFSNMMMMENQDGGFIILSKELCPIEHDKSTPLYMALATSETLQVPGCWFFQDMTVYVVWFQQDQPPFEAEYPALNFKFVSEDKK
jgi:hypothetical protein